MQRPAPPPLPNGTLAAVSCAATGGCAAVGNFLDNAGTYEAFEERWNGSRWLIDPIHNPAGATGSFLTGVSCVSASSCVTVGYLIDSAGVRVTFAESWNGSGWSMQTTPNPAGATLSVLNGVSCAAAGACVAVGSYTDSSGHRLALAESWDGAAWSIQTVPGPSGALASALAGVSCPSATACTAVGYAVNSAHANVTLAESWNGTAWTVQSTPTPAGATASVLSSVSCPSASTCTAVGNDTTSGAQQTLAESWNGTAWTVQPTPNPASSLSLLSAVSCTSSSACTAVGTDNSSSTRVTLAESWNGTVWSLQSTPNPTGARISILSGVTCMTVSACTTVGYSNPSTGTRTSLAESFGASGWAIQTTPNPPGAQTDVFHAVSCASATACTAVGDPYLDNTTGTYVGLAESWNGTTWSIEKLNADSTGGVPRLWGVSCASASSCTAVGNTGNYTAAESWNGTSWELQTTPNPSGATSSVFNSVSCTSTTACTAVGGSGSSSAGAQTLAETWDGTSWSIQPTPIPSTGNGFLLGVSCVSSIACTAAGEASGDGGPVLAEGWDGTAWSIQPTPNPLPTGPFNSVSCASPTACTAVGDFTNNHNVQATLAERWDGTTWSIQNTPTAPGATDGVLNGVSCASATACTAVGTYIDKQGHQVTLAQSWNGITWTFQPTLVPPGITYSTLNGVSCTTPTTCTAVGTYKNKAGTSVPLAERYS